MQTKKISMRLSDGSKFLAKLISQGMAGSSRTSVIELAILELAHSELKRGRIKPEDWQAYEHMIQRGDEGEGTDAVIGGGYYGYLLPDTEEVKREEQEHEQYNDMGYG